MNTANIVGKAFQIGVILIDCPPTHYLYPLSIRLLKGYDLEHTYAYTSYGENGSYGKSFV